MPNLDALAPLLSEFAWEIAKELMDLRDCEAEMAADAAFGGAPDYDRQDSVAEYRAELVQIQKSCDTVLNAIARQSLGLPLIEPRVAEPPLDDDAVPF